jgi:hypothetical protein
MDQHRLLTFAKQAADYCGACDAILNLACDINGPQIQETIEALTAFQQYMKARQSRANATFAPKKNARLITSVDSFIQLKVNAVVSCTVCCRRSHAPRRFNDLRPTPGFTHA